MRILNDDSFIFLLLYVDDMLIVGNHLSYVNELKSLLSKEFEIYDLGPTKKILGMDIHKDRRSKKTMALTTGQC